MPVITLAAAGSFGAQLTAVIQGAPLWLYVLAALAPWLPIAVLEISWTYRHYRWLTLFCLLIMTQSLYFLAHVAQALGAPWIVPVHVVWAALAFIGLGLLASRFPRNPWLWIALAIALVDLAPVDAWQARLALATMELIALNVAFAQQLGRTYDAWLARAFPDLPEDILIETTGRLEEVHLRAGERVEQQPGQWFIVTHGMGALVRRGPGGHDILLRVLGPGTVVRDGGLIAADTTLELLALPVAD